MTQFHQLRRSITSYDPKELFRRSPLPYHDVRAIGIIPQNSECYTIPTSSFCPLPLKCLFALTHRDGEQPKGDGFNKPMKVEIAAVDQPHLP